MFISTPAPFDILRHYLALQNGDDIDGIIGQFPEASRDHGPLKNSQMNKGKGGKKEKYNITSERKLEKHVEIILSMEWNDAFKVMPDINGYEGSQSGKKISTATKQHQWTKRTRSKKKPIRVLRSTRPNKHNVRKKKRCTLPLPFMNE